MNRRHFQEFLFALAIMIGLTGWAHAQNAAALKNSYKQLQEKLKNNQFNQPIVMDSEQTSKSISGDVYSVINYPFSTVRAALDTPEEWCDVLFLHLNVKYCRALNSQTIDVYAGTKKPQPLKDAFHMAYNFKPVINNASYLQIVLDAQSGPMGTSDYYMMMEAIPLPENQTFLHVNYSYHFGMMAKLATNLYLDTVGSSKKGFTITGKKPDGKPKYVSGLRGAIERNTMRYYLAIEAYLGSLSQPPAQQEEIRLKNWFAATERYPQLYEISRQQYLNMKDDEFKQTPPIN